MLRKLAFVCMLLAGCAANPPKVTEVRVPVPVSCVTDKPEHPDKAVARDDTVAEKVRAKLIDLQRLEGYTAKLEAIVAGCE